jgi:hypothetical protein
VNCELMTVSLSRQEGHSSNQLLPNGAGKQYVCSSYAFGFQLSTYAVLASYAWIKSKAFWTPTILLLL